jgi:hypothetical protein
VTISLPEIEREHSTILYPLKMSLATLDQLSIELIDIVDPYVPVLSTSKKWCRDHSSENWILRYESCLLTDLSDHALLWSLPCFELALYSIPLSFVDIVFAFVAVEHQDLSILVYVGERCEFHNSNGVRRKKEWNELLVCEWNAELRDRRDHSLYCMRRVYDYREKIKQKNPTLVGESGRRDEWMKFETPKNGHYLKNSQIIFPKYLAFSGFSTIHHASI